MSSSASASIKAYLVEKEYQVTYSENSGKIFGLDVLVKTFSNGNTSTVLLRTHSVNIDISNPEHKQLHHSLMENLDANTKFVDPVCKYFDALDDVYGS